MPSLRITGPRVPPGSLGVSLLNPCSLRFTTWPFHPHFSFRRDSADSRSSTVTTASSSSSPQKRPSVERRPSTGSNPAASPPGSRKNSSDGKEERPNSARSKPETPKTPSSPSSPTFAPTICFLASCYLTGDSVRDKCVEMISAALKMDDDYKQFGVNCDKMASEIEDHILWLAGLRLGSPALLLGTEPESKGSPAPLGLLAGLQPTVSPTAFFS
uniref:Transcription elongation factor A3 n=1 Tax=Chrysemys picta bellii TaxID=8478 RepID=A0A8C3FWY8_CHRPI